MKTLFKSLALLTLLTFSFAPSLVRAQDDSSDEQDVSFQAFYDQLGDQGQWVQTDDYGYVFQPNVSDPDWAPYTDGYWVDSPAGYTWVSDEPWGWATYHYGRWANIDGIGWVWVPGYRWAPAWVSWRYGGGYCGWAPLPPETMYGAEYDEPGVNVGVGFHFGGDVDVTFGIGAGCYNFVRVEDFGDHDYRRARVNRYQNYEIINHTNNITNINVHHGMEGDRFRGVVAGGPPLNEVNAHSRQHIQTVNFTAANQPGANALQGNSLAIYAPRVNPHTLHEARPGTVAQTINHPTFNRGNSISQPLEVTASVKPPPPSPEMIHAAQDAELHAPTTAKIATSHTQIKTTTHLPITSLEPATSVPNTGKPNHNANNFNNPETPGNGNSNFHPATTPHPASTFNSQNQGNGGEQGGGNPNGSTSHHTFNSQNQGNGGGNPSLNTLPVTTFHPQNQGNGGEQGGGNPNGSTSHHTFNSQNQGNGGGNPPPTTPPVTTFHPQNQGNGGGNPPPNTPPVTTFHPQNQGNGGGGGGQGGNHSSGGGQGGGNRPPTTNAPPSHPAHP